MTPSKDDRTDGRVITALVASPLFAGLSRGEVARVAAFCRLNHYTKGNIVFVEGDYGNAFYVVAAGEIKVFKGSPEGREVIVKVMRTGDLVGEAAALGGRPYPASAQALDEALAVEVPRRKFLAQLKEEPAMALKAIIALTERLYEVSAVLEKLTLKEVPSRLAAYLIEHAARDADGGARVVFKTAKQALAAELGTVPEVLSRALRKFASAGFIKPEKGYVVLTDEHALQKLAEGFGK